MNTTNDVWIKTKEQKLRALLADEAKQMNIIAEMQDTIRQMKAKSSFRIALINQLLEDEGYKKD